MKVSPVGKETRSEYNMYLPKKQKSEFSSALRTTQMDQQEHDLKIMLNNIKNMGDRLKATNAIPDMIEYKKCIQEYLYFVTHNYYQVLQDRRYYGDILLRVDVINKEVDELTQQLLQEEKTNLAIADKIDKITGLLVDLFI